MSSNNNQQKNLPQSIWKQDNSSSWVLLYDTNVKSDTSKTNENNLKNIFDTQNNKKKLKLGSLVMTPKGIGRLLKLEEGQVVVKLQQGDEQITLDESQAKSEFNINICIKSEIDNWYRLRAPANGTVETIKHLLQDIGILNLSNNDFVLIYNGEEVKDELFLDQLGVKNNAKFLLCQTKMTQFKITRFTNTYTWWYFSSTDGITFVVNKKIKLGGLGLYGSHESKIFRGTLRVFEGSMADRGATLYEEQTEVPASSDQNNCITYVNFKKPVTIKPDIDYTIMVENSGGDYLYIYYGSGSKAMIEGDKGVIFTFKYTPGSSFSSSIESGNFPEIIYYA
jgi:hypothetical protein